MIKHKWSQEDYVLLVKNIRQYGLTAGCEKTAKEINSTSKSCKNYYYNKIGKSDNPDLRYGIRNIEKELKIAEFLKKEIENNPNNLTQCFKNTAKEFGYKSYISISQRWYGVKCGKKIDFSNNPSCRNNIGHVYSIVSKKSTINGKNQNIPDLDDTKKLHWFVKLYYRLFKRKNK